MERLSERKRAVSSLFLMGVLLTFRDPLEMLIQGQFQKIGTQEKNKVNKLKIKPIVKGNAIWVSW